MTAGWREELRSRGYRVTPQRQLVLEAVSSLEHGTPEQICDEVRRTASGVNISTIYRTLELLEGLGLVVHTHLGHGAPTYHPADRADHVHLVCRGCGSVIQVTPAVTEELVTTLRSDYGFAADVQHLTVFGRCQQCRAAETASAPGGQGTPG